MKEDPPDGKAASKLLGLDGESRRLLTEILPRHSPRPGMTAQEMRENALELARVVQGEPPEVARVFDQKIQSDGHIITLRIYNPEPSVPAPCLVWLHGGGFVTGGLDAHDTLCRQLCAASGLIVVSVDYRLAPEHPFPAAANDAYAAVVWAARSSELLGARPGAIAVGGSSAGGNLAAASCLMARDRDGPRINRQVLVYPLVDAEMRHPSYKTHGEGYQLTSDMMSSYMDAYAPRGIDRKDPLLSPLRAPSLAGLPPAHVVIAEFDPLHDEIVEFAETLEKNGVPVRTSMYRGVMHGFFGQAGVLSKARAAQKAVCEDLRQNLFAHLS